MKMQSIPKRGRKDSVIYSETRHGKVARAFVPPRNPRTAQQQDHRHNVRAVSGRWHTLALEQRAAWRTFAASKVFVNEEGSEVRLNGYNFFVSLNTRRADLDLPQFDVPPAEPVFSPNPVDELVATLTGGKFLLKLHVSDTPAQYTLVHAAAPVRSGVRYVHNFPFLELLPPPKDGWSDITEPYVARYDVPKANQAIWIRTCQHIDGWIDVPKVLRARLLAPAAAAAAQ
jgi:hypothetical protein